MRQITVLAALLMAASIMALTGEVRAEDSTIARSTAPTAQLIRDGWRTIVVQPIHSITRREK